MGLVPPPSLRGARIELREPPTFKTSRDGFLPVEFSAGGGGSARTLAVGFHVTTDGGTTWTPRYMPLASEDERYGQVPLAAGGSAPLLALVGHEARKVLTSRDGGHGWTSAATGLEGRYPAVRGLAFADHRTGWAVAGRGVSLENGCVPPTRRCDADGALLVTTSAGATWSDATPTQHGQVVEVQDTVGRHPVIGREQDLRRYPPDPLGRRDSGDLVDHRDHGLPGQHEERPAAHAWLLDPPHLAAVHQGSSSLMLRRLASARPSNSSSSGTRV